MNHAADELVSQAEAARRLGVSANAVNKLVKAKKIPLINGRVPIAVLGDVLAQKLDPSRSKILQNAAKASAANGAEPSTAAPISGALVLDYATAKAQREHYEGLRAKLEYERRCGELVELERVRGAAYRIGRLTRDTLLAIPAKVATELANVSDHWQIEQTLAAALRKALDDVSRMAKSDLDREVDA